MLCTVIHDAYRDDERADIRDALKILVSPSQPDWSAKGVYAYWDYASHDLLYLGLASNLVERFEQHNRLVPHSGGNKQKEIDDYFAEKELLGFTVMLQSKAVQVWEIASQINPTLGGTAAEIISVGEGQLIETHRLTYGSRPPWNRIGGSRDGKRFAITASGLLDTLAARRASLFVTRRTLRELAANLKCRFFEATIHAARIRAFMDAHEVPLDPTELEAIESEDLVRLVERTIMLRSGHIVDDLDSSDYEIRRWLEVLADPGLGEREAAVWRSALESAEGAPLAGREKEMADYLDSVMTEPLPVAHIMATAEILETRYLEEPQPYLLPSTAG